MDKYIVVPGLVDMHVHFREPGQEHKEDIRTGSLAAVHGGYTCVCCMPNTSPVVDNAKTVEYVLMRGREAGLVNVLTAGALSRGLNGETLTDFKSMKQAGVMALSDDGKTLADYDLMRTAAERAKKLGLPITDHAEPEAEIVARDIKLARETGVSMHLQHISLAESIALIRTAKKENLPVTAETAPHYFTLNQDALIKHGANAKMNPPLRTEADRLAVIEGLMDHTIDVIATDHAPHTPDEKTVPFDQAPNGIVGLETAFAVSYTVLVKNGLLSLERLIELMSVNPARLLGYNASKLDWAVFDIAVPYTINSGAFASKGRSTPFEGMEVVGKTIITVVDGKVVYHDRSDD